MSNQNKTTNPTYTVDSVEDEDERAPNVHSSLPIISPKQTGRKKKKNRSPNVNKSAHIGMTPTLALNGKVTK